jgi:hypothetical protein
MNFSEREIRFLTAHHQLEYATTGRRELREIVDMRELGCPDRVFFRVLEDRARKLGPKWAEFRSAGRAPHAHVRPTLPLASDLF